MAGGSWRILSLALLVRAPSRLGDPSASGGLGGLLPGAFGEDDLVYSEVDGVLALVPACLGGCAAAHLEVSRLGLSERTISTTLL